jgi:hypothetical protein
VTLCDEFHVFEASVSPRASLQDVASLIAKVAEENKAELADKFSMASVGIAPIATGAAAPARTAEGVAASRPPGGDPPAPPSGGPGAGSGAGSSGGGDSGGDSSSALQARFAALKAK